MPQERTVIVHQEPKNLAVAVILTLIFGPLGMLYATISGGLIMGAVNLLILVISFLTFGIGSVFFLITWPVCVIWTIISVNTQNKKALTELMQFQPEARGGQYTGMYGDNN
ncbi:hypothetical protein [Ferrovum sp.]|uniref:hypothetical protein n=1 Tax=Ferrovum sp. TaxID=2609467 RepID=UPI0026047706|nr:hypothetical protein [Ferrovum sp.]